MNRLVSFFIIISSVLTYCHEPITIEVAGKQAEKTPLVIITTGQENGELLDVAETIKKDLEFTGQFSIQLEHYDAVKKKSHITKWYTQKCLFALILEDTDKAVITRLYKTEKAKSIANFSVKKEGVVPRGWGHNLSDLMIHTLTATPGFFSTKLTYYNQTKKAIYIADYDGSHEQVLRKVSSSAVAPCWNKDFNNPMVLFSEYTKKNIRLVACDLQGNKYAASNFEGLNMQPTFSPDGKEVVLCISQTGSSQLYKYGYDKHKKEMTYTQLTFNTGNNISPLFLKNGDLIFCSDYKTGKPHLYYMHMKTGTTEKLTSGNSCLSPSYCALTDTLAYTKMVNGHMQIMEMPLATKQEQQITFDATHKQESTWSACGNYLVYSYIDKDTKNKLALFHKPSGRLHTKNILSHNDSCCFPDFSVPYKVFPVLS